MNISKTKRNFIWWHTLFAVISGALGAVILHFALPGHYFGGYHFICNSKCRSRCSDFTRCPTGTLFRRISVYSDIFLSVWFVQYLYVRCVSAACSAKDVTAVFGNKNGKDDSFDNSSLDLLPCRA